MDSRELDIVRKYGSDTAEALAHFMKGDFSDGLQILKSLINQIESMGSQSSDGEGGYPVNPEQGQVNPDGSYITIESWFTNNGWPAPLSPDQTPIPGNFFWGPNAPNPEHPDWLTAEWVWRPALA